MLPGDHGCPTGRGKGRGPRRIPVTHGFRRFPHQSVSAGSRGVQLHPACLAAYVFVLRGPGGGGRPQHVLPRTSPSWKSKSELEGVRVRLPAWQGRRNGSVLEPPSPVGPGWGFPASLERERERGREPGAAPRGALRGVRAAGEGGGRGLPHNIPISCSAGCLGKGRGESREGSRASATPGMETQPAEQPATWGLFELLMGNAATAPCGFLWPG